ncbi:hypothetical protein CSUB01_10957 [Colletotrichum sublineola]|uniref:Zn(2)-C6 fungal-type domain-containing protein n=1 Tax=Colletotrichum sublineola TaxID=1173701 RepID=A0A066XRS8_COLSU|nr:hypothetical protein CSUB01_10957 [Colletotrichum sublineola]
MSSHSHTDASSAASTSLAGSSDSQQTPKRARTSKPKVKTGCNNCKQRRIKCDEKWPSCSQCHRSKKICTGYPPPSRSERPHEVLAIAPKPLAPAQDGVVAPLRTSSIEGLPPRRQQKLQARRPTPPQTPGPPSMVTLYQPANNLQLTPQEGLYFQLFRFHTANELTGHFDSVFWTRTVLQECHSENAICHAVVALGALYKTLEQTHEFPPDSPSELMSPTDRANRHWEVAVKQYSEAINALVHLRRDQKSHRTLLMASVLLACFDSFVGDHRQAILQIQNGLGLLEKLREERRKSLMPIFDEPVEEELITMFTRLAIQAKSYDMAFHFPEPYVIRQAPQTPEFPQSPPSDTGSLPSTMSSVSMPDQFSNLIEARIAWDKLLEKMLRFTETLFVYQKSTGANGPIGILPRSLKKYGMNFEGQLDAWSKAFDYLLESRTAPGVSFQEKAGIAVLKMLQIMNQILFLMTYSDSESEFDVFQFHFKAIVDLASEVVSDEERRAVAKRCPDPIQCPQRHNHTPEYNTYHIKPSFSADLGIVPPLFMVATKCRHPVIRRQAIQLLRSSARREGMWDSELAARIGQWVATIEEDGNMLGPSLNLSSSLMNGNGGYSSVDFDDDTPLGLGGNARWDVRRDGVTPGQCKHESKQSVPEEKRVVLQAVDFDLRARFANLQVGTRGIIAGMPDMRSRVTQITWPAPEQERVTSSFVNEFHTFGVKPVKPFCQPVIVGTEVFNTAMSESTGRISCEWEVPAVYKKMRQASPSSTDTDIMCLLSKFVVLTGDGEIFECSTCAEFLEKRWHRAGLDSLRIICQGIRDLSVRESAAKTHSEQESDTREYLDVDGVQVQNSTANNIEIILTRYGPKKQELAEAMVWICTAMRLPPATSNINLGLFKSTSAESVSSLGNTSFELLCKLQPLQEWHLDTTSNSGCWAKLFHTGVIAKHHLQRTWGKGLELSFEMMVHLATVENHSALNMGTILLGFRTALVPVDWNEERRSIQWHFEVAERSGFLHPAELQATQQDWVKFRDASKFRDSTCFVGWFDNAHILLGTRELLDATIGMAWSATEECQQTLRPKGVEGGAQIALSIGPINIAPQAVKTWEFVSNVQRYNPTNQYRQTLQSSHGKVAIVIDSHTKQAWLVPMLSLILHL